MGMRLGDPCAPRTRAAPAAGVAFRARAAARVPLSRDTDVRPASRWGSEGVRPEGPAACQLPLRLLIRAAAAFLGAGESTFALALFS